VSALQLPRRKNANVIGALIVGFGPSGQLLLIAVRSFCSPMFVIFTPPGTASHTTVRLFTG